MKRAIIASLWVIMCFACAQEPEITDDLLDGNTLFDPALYEPESRLLSYALPNPTPEQAARPVVIACHGYTASTFEWDEFRSWIDEQEEEVYVSQVLLGGHGRTYADFKLSGWKDWQAAITEEYNRLEQAGYENISLLGASTSCALFLELLASDYFRGRRAPRQILLVDPIVIPSNKSLSLVGVFGPMLGYLETEQSAEENKMYYRFRPQETLQELQKLTTIVRKDLEQGIVLPQHSALKVYKSKKDGSADPVSAALIHKGARTFEGGPVEIEMVDSDLHVYTRLALRDDYTARDLQNQQDTFSDILNRVLR